MLALAASVFAAATAAELAPLRHLEAFQAIANEFGDRSPEVGYIPSVEYVEAILAAEAPSFSVVRQDVPAEMWSAIAPAMLCMGGADCAAEGVDFSVLQYSGSGKFAGVATTAVAGLGCDAGDFASFAAGTVAIVSRGECALRDKAVNAVDAGAIAVLIANDEDGLVAATLQEPVPVPVFGVTRDLGAALSAAGAVVDVEAETEVRRILSPNLIVDVPGGSPTNVIVVGAHLDGVPGSPAVNDNGSGTATVLEALVSLHRKLNETGLELENSVRFGFWSLEEIGLIGSAFYVDSLVESGDIRNVVANLNYDMTVSSNWARLVLDGRNGPADVAYGSGQIQRLFEEYYDDLPTDPTAFNGRSDYGPFIEVGIPAGGVFTGAEALKTAEQVQKYGGQAGEQLCPHYHLASDSLENALPAIGICNEITACLDAVLEEMATMPDIRGFLGLPSASDMPIARRGRASASMMPRQGPFFKV